MRPRLILTLLLLFPLVCLAQSQKGSAAPYRDQPLHNPFQGARIFHEHCAACHGTDGRGHGPAAVALRHTLPDLTVVSQRNGGRFPYRRMRDLIEGKEPTRLAHGNREMPTWGPVFHEIEADQDWGEVRLDAVTRYIESIQQK